MTDNKKCGKGITGWMHRSMEKMAPIFLRILLVIILSLYVVFGALILSYLEKKQVNRSNAISQSDLSPVYKNGWKESWSDTRHCVTDMIMNLLKQNNNCSNIWIDKISFRYFKYCYHLNAINNDNDDNLSTATHITTSFNDQDMENKMDDEWSFFNSLLFAFSLITTIGYGNITPKNFAGQMFCIFFASFGVPLTLLVIADLGQFIAQIIFSINDHLNAQIKKFWRRFIRRNQSKFIEINETLQKFTSSNFNAKPMDLENDDNNHGINEQNNDKKDDNHDDDDDDVDDDNIGDDGSVGTSRSLTFFILFIIYLIAGSFLISSYEPKMTFLTALYFNFITLTSVGLGDIVPERRAYIILTIFYITIGLAFTTIAIEIAADTLKKMHYFGRKIKDFGNIEIWFGGKRLTVRQIIRNLCDQFNVPDKKVIDLNIENFIVEAIKVEAGERAPLRDTTPRQEIYFDDSDETIEPEPALEHETETECISQAEDLSKNESVNEEIPKPTLILEQESEQELKIEPDYESQPESQSEEIEIPVVMIDDEEPPEIEPVQVVAELEPEPIPELYLELLKDEEMPNEPEMSVITPSKSALEVINLTKEPESKHLKPVQSDKKTEKRPPISVNSSRHKGYSEEARRRYQEYQNEWSRFRNISPNSTNSKQQNIPKNS